MIVVGAGPAGATLAYYLAKYGRKVLLLEKKAFPRDKICGDALVKTAIEILKDMGVLDKLTKDNRIHVVCSNGTSVDTCGYLQLSFRFKNPMVILDI